MDWRIRLRSILSSVENKDVEGQAQYSGQALIEGLDTAPDVQAAFRDLLTGKAVDESIYQLATCHKSYIRMLNDGREVS
jgi:hypothetical protein